MTMLGFRAPLDMRKVLIWQLTDRGFGSEIINLLLARLFALDKHLDFAICSRYWNAAAANGWSDYFLPFTREFDHGLLRHNLIYSGFDFRTLSWRKLRRALVGYSAGQAPLFNDDIWSEIRSIEFLSRTFSLPSQQGPVASFPACHALLRDIWRLNDVATKHVETETAKMGLRPEQYVACLVRRGDKWKEALEHPLQVYLMAMQSRRWEDGCFLMTDDHRSYGELLSVSPELRLLTLCRPEQQGHDQQMFNNRSADERKRDTLQLLAEITIAVDAHTVIGTQSSNLFRLIGLLRNGRNMIDIEQNRVIY